MATRIATAHTRKAKDYMRKLCIHWSQKFTVTYDDSLGQIDFGEQRTAELRVTAEELQVTVTATDDTQADKLADIVAEHIARYAQKESLTFEWQPQP